MRNLVSVVKWLIILVVILGLAFLVYAGVKISKPLKTEAEEEVFVVSPGESTQQIAHILEQERLINRALFFVLNSYLRNQGGKFQAGSYALSPAMPISEIAERLASGKVIDDSIKFTVVEGWSVTDIGKSLEESGIVKSREFLQAALPSPLAGGLLSSGEFAFLAQVPRQNGLQGFLFPDTYFFRNQSSGEEIVRKMVRNFDQKLGSDLRKAISEQKKSIYEIVTLASIVEKEVGRNVPKGAKLSEAELKKLEEERRWVAGVFYNRLAAGIPLESDATISYLTGRKGSARATLEETKIQSPYNTYRNRGLPPGPISNPSLDALEAAIYPADTDYLYFVTAPDGTAYFAKTLEEHKRNRARYLE